MSGVPGGTAQPGPGDSGSVRGGSGSGPGDPVAGPGGSDSVPGDPADLGDRPPAQPSAAADFSADRDREEAATARDRYRYRTAPPLQWPLMLVLSGLLVSLIIVATDHFRRGSVLFAAFVVGAFVLRLVLPERDAGWLAVRSRGVDLLVLGFLGLGLSVFALIVPSPS